MNYPNFPNKHLYETTLDPSDIAKNNKIKSKLPTNYILLYSHSWMRKYLIKKYKPKIIRIDPLLEILVHKNIGFVIMSGIGCPHAVVILEELIAYGGKRFLNIGTAGGLKERGIFVCTHALRDEGTSHHYLPFGKFITPSKVLTSKLKESLAKNGIIFKEGTTWTIDAPFRETKKEVVHYAKEGIATVEMEASALFAVAQYRKKEIASVFVVSDLPRNKNNSLAKRFDTKKELQGLVNAGVFCLT